MSPAVRGGCQRGWGRLPSVTHAIETGTWRQWDSGWAFAGRPGGGGGGTSPCSNASLGLPPPLLQTKGTIVGKNEIYHRENLIESENLRTTFGTPIVGSPRPPLIFPCVWGNTRVGSTAHRPGGVLDAGA